MNITHILVRFAINNKFIMAEKNVFFPHFNCNYMSNFHKFLQLIDSLPMNRSQSTGHIMSTYREKIKWMETCQSAIKDTTIGIKPYLITYCSNQFKWNKTKRSNVIVAEKKNRILYFFAYNMVRFGLTMKIVSL